MPEPIQNLDEIHDLINQHGRGTTIATPMYSALRIDQHPTFNVAALAARAGIPFNRETGEYTGDLDFDLARAQSPHFTRLSSAIERAANARRFQP